VDASLVVMPSIVALALLALKRGYLTLRGAVSAAAVGLAVAAASLGLFAVLTYFFISSSLLTRLRAEWKREVGLKDVSGRSLRQVVGVGTPIAVFSLAYLASGDPRLLTAAATAVAVAAADTWASEVGVAYGGAPRYILAPWRRVDPGTSGGVTPIGAAASAAGALTTALLAHALGLGDAWKIALLGYLGEVIDSVLGASLQVKYLCGPQLSEVPRPGCIKRGFLSNEAVNLVSGLAVGALAVLTP